MPDLTVAAGVGVEAVAGAAGVALEATAGAAAFCAASISSIFF
ncbi:hypothetical protein DSC_14880 [Pseudoxanthomonas spadix BD-a59]|uniref:Uncharacterized protein n=1 Tax=Pseudoxanthomonas spadix (strain BD-a59) TaxID=1045855 RepID=G7UVF9_PSEUP|nr:hypothetical protein DSC_14880 [Pseudoxanthomonas spadix BD-a59]